MANTKSARKRNRQNEKRRLRNRRYLGLYRSAIKNARTAIEAGNIEEAEGLVRSACAEIDRAASKGVIHKNNAARRKSRLHAALHRVQAEA